MNWFIQCFTEKYADFSGRARRAEFWYFYLFYYIAAIAIGIVDAILAQVIGFGGLLVIYSLAGILPSLAVTVRRLHDTGRSGWWFLIGFVPLVGGIVLLVFFLQSGDFDRNEYGPPPKAKPIV